MKVVFLFLAFSLPALAVENETVSLEQAFANRIQAYEEAERARLEQEEAVRREAEAARLQIEAQEAAMLAAEMHRLHVFESQTHWVGPKALEALNIVLTELFATSFGKAELAPDNRIYFTLGKAICELKYYRYRNATLRNFAYVENGVNGPTVHGMDSGVRGLDGVFAFSLHDANRRPTGARCVSPSNGAFFLFQLNSVYVRVRRGIPVRSSDAFFPMLAR